MPTATPKVRKKRPICRTCGRRVHIPEGWSVGPAVRRHYWKHHPEVMQPEKKEVSR